MAGSSSDIEAGKAYVTLYVKDSQLIKGLAGINKHIEKIQKAVLKLADLMLLLGASINGALGAAVGRFENVGSELNDMSARTAVAAGTLAQFAYAAEQTGASMEDLEAGLRNMQKSAVAGDKAFGKIGLSAQQLNKLSVEEKFIAVAEGLSKVKSPSQRAALAMEILGKSGVKLLPMLSEGADGLRRMREEAVRLGAPTTEETKLADDLGDAMGRMRAIAKNAAFAIGSALAGSMIEVLEVTQGAAEGTLKWVRANHELIRTAGKIGSSLLVGSLALRVFSSVLTAVRVGMGLLGAATLPAAFILGILRNRLYQVSQMAMSALGSVKTMAAGMTAALAGIGKNTGTITGGLARIALGFAQIGLSAGTQLGLAAVRGIIAATPLVLQGVRAVGLGALEVLKFHAQQMAVMFAPVGKWIAARMGPGVRKAFFEVFMAASTVLAKTEFIWRPVISAGRLAIRSIAAFWKSGGAGMGSTLSSVLIGAFNRVRSVGVATMTAIRAGAANIGRGVGGVVSGVSGLLGMAGGMAGGALGSTMQSLGSIMMMGTMVVGLLNPVTLTVAAIAAAAYAWTQFSDSGKAALKAVMDVIQPFIDIARQTVTGISDAFTTGDIQLAGKIAFSGLKLIVIQAMNEIGAYIGGVFGETLGAVSGQIGSGDLSGAWSTALQGLGAMWDAWSEGVVKTFTAAMRVVTDLWKSTVSGMANWALQQSAQGGVMGKMASTMLGIDMSQEQARAELNKQKDIDVQQRRVDRGKAELARAQANGGSLDERGGMGQTAAEIQAAIDDAERSLARARGESTDVVAGAAEQVEAQVGGTADAVKKYLDEIDATATAQANKSGEELAVKVKGGNAAGDKAQADAQAELDRLTAQAGRKAAEVRARADNPKNEDIQAPDVASMRRQSFGSFSAAGLMAVGQGGVQQRMLEEIKKQRAIAAEQVKAMERVRQAVKDNQLQVVA